MSFWGTRPSPFTSAEVAVLQAIAGTTFTNGQLLIGKGSTGGLAVATLVQGANMTITNGDGTITLASSGGAGGMTVGTTTITSGTDTRILYDNAGVLGEYTISGSGTVVAMATSPSFTTPTLGVASATTINKLTITPPASGSTLTIVNGKTLTVSNTIALAAGADSQTFTFPTASDTVAGLATAQTFTGVNIFTPGARGSGTAAYFTITVPADTAQTASTESIGIKTVTATRTWATTGTVALQREIYLAGVTYASASASQTFTDATTLYIDKPVAGTNAIFTRAHSLTIVDSTSAASSITGGFVISTTLGTTATSVGIGGGNINAGGTLVVGGHVTLEGVTSTGATGTNLLVFATSPTLTTPVLGVATATSINSLTISTSTGTLTITNLKTVSHTATTTFGGTDGKTVAFNNSITFAGTDSTTMTFPGASDTVAGLGTSQTFTGIQTFTPTARSSGVASYLVINIPADTGQTAATESIGIKTVTATRTWATTGTVALQREIFFAGPTYASASASQTFTDATTLHITPPVVGSNAIFTRGHSLTIVDATSAASSITGGFVIATTLGTTATSVGIGGGNINAGGTLTVGGHVTVEGVTSTGATGTGKFVFDGSPTLVTPNIGQATATNVIYTNNAVTASANAATVPVTSRLTTVTNNSAATLTITITTASATDGQLVMVRILDFSAVAQTITWVNTENSTVSAPTTSNGSTTLFLTVGFIYNSGTSKWRCIASA